MSLSIGSRNAVFPTTRWSVVAAAGQLSGADDDAIGTLYGMYWPAVYAYVRHRGYGREDAEDIVQSFFSHLIESRALGRANPLRGRFRSFLLASLKNFMRSDYRRRTALKRGGDPRLTLDSTNAETWYTTCAVDFAAPDHVYDLRWALALLERARRRLRREFIDDDKEALFNSLIPHLIDTDRRGPLERAAGLPSRGARRVALHRFRRRFGELLRDEIRRTVAAPERVDDELRHLVEVVGRRRPKRIA